MINNYDALCIKCKYEFQANDITFSNIAFDVMVQSYVKCMGCVHIYEDRYCNKIVSELDGLFYTGSKPVQSEAEFDFYYSVALKKKRKIKEKREKEARYNYV